MTLNKLRKAARSELRKPDNTTPQEQLITIIAIIILIIIAVKLT